MTSPHQSQITTLNVGQWLPCNCALYAPLSRIQQESCDSGHQHQVGVHLFRTKIKI